MEASALLRPRDDADHVGMALPVIGFIAYDGAGPTCPTQDARGIAHRATVWNEQENAMHLNWHELIGGLKDPLGQVRAGQADVMRNFSGLAQSALKTGALDTKTKELIALAVSVALRCDDCIGFHSKAALQSGASRDEVLEALGMAIYMGAGPSVMYASHAIEAFDQFATQAADGPKGSAA
jgi:AhpD family alkylhydroperoxidase